MTSTKNIPVKNTPAIPLPNPPHTRLVEDGDQTTLYGLDDLDVPAVGLVVAFCSGAGAVYLLLQRQLYCGLLLLAPSLRGENKHGQK